MKVLFLTPWYPSEKDAMAGLFVQKHVEAVRAQGAEVEVIHSQDWKGLYRQWRALKKRGWMPDVVQLNVIQKQGLLALWLKRRYAIPYIIVEHWSGYLKDNGEWQSFSRSKKALTRRICREAEEVLTVSGTLQEAMKQCGMNAQRWGMIDNVVDDFFFDNPTPSLPHTEGVKTLLHVSCFDERAKNVKGLLRAAKMLAQKREDWQLVMIGTGVDYDEVREYAEALEIPEGILRWTGELTPREVAQEMHRADALVLSSRYETYGVVLAEAAAAGLPILSTPVGIAGEVARLIVPQEIAQHKPGRFAEFMETVLWNTDRCSRKTADKNRFSAWSIGEKLMKIYDSCLHNDI